MDWVYDIDGMYTKHELAIVQDAGKWFVCSDEAEVIGVFKRKRVAFKWADELIKLINAARVQAGIATVPAQSQT